MSVKYKSVRYTTPASGFNVKEFNLIEDVEDDEVLIKISYAALNPADILLSKMSSLTLSKKEKGFGREFVGEIVKFGAKFTEAQEQGLKTGDYVAGVTMGAIPPEGPVGQYFKFKSGAFTIAKINLDNVSDSKKDDLLKKISSIPLVFETAYTLIFKIKKLPENAKVLVIGGGTQVGLYVLQLLTKIEKLEHVVTIQSSKTDAIYAKLGLKYKSINYDKVEIVTAEASDYIKNELNGEKFDAILDCVGDSQFLAKIDEYLKTSTEDDKKGYYGTIAADAILDYTKDSSIFNNAYGFLKTFARAFVPFFKPSNYFYHLVMMKIDSKSLSEGIEYIIKNEFETLIDTVYDLDQIDAAIEKLSTHHAKGKIVIKA